MPKAHELAIVSSPDFYGGQIRALWETGFPEATFFDAPTDEDLPRQMQSAIAAGFPNILIACARYPHFLPKNSPAKLLLYLDSSPIQANWIRTGKPPTLKLKQTVKRIRETAKQHTFLAMSRLAAHGIAEELHVPPSQIRVVPPPVAIPANLIPSQPGGPLKVITGPTSESFEDADLLVLPELDDIYPISAAKALAHAVPVIIRNLGAAAEVVEDGKSGILLDTSDSKEIQRAIENYENKPDRLLREGEAGRQHVQKYNSLEKHVQKIWAALR